MNFLQSAQNLKNHFLKKENIFYFTIVIIIFFLDRFSKLKILNQFSENIHYINNFINFDLIWNTGIGFGLLSFNSSLFYNLVSILIGLVVLILIYIFLISEKYEKLIYALIIGGAFGNFYDRLVYKAVPDFIDLHYNNFHWFTFNVADIFITLGILAFILRSFCIKN
tara:strand:+ start:2427 stop:2927 length:501 start_codon:yes stop_codon:yes gene_type:complete